METAFVIVTGLDDAAGRVYALCVSAAEDVWFGYKYQDIPWSDGDGFHNIDRAMINSIRPAQFSFDYNASFGSS